MALFCRMKAVFLIVFLSSFTLLNGQNFVMDGNPVSTCSGFFLDSGGGDNPYGPNETITQTICATGIAGDGTHIQLVFSGVNFPEGDSLFFFDGDNVNAPAFNPANDFEPDSPFIIQATAANGTGCVTVQFVSDGSNESEGWSAEINCVSSCQNIQAVLVSSDPPVFPVDTGWIDTCPGQRISLSAIGEYPQNGIAYDHSDLTSEFHWDFGDGSNAVGPNVTHEYEESGGYIVQLTIIDQEGCTNTNFINQRVRVSPAPDFTPGGMIPDQICAGDTLNLNATVGALDANSLISVTPGAAGFQSGGIRSDSLALPDGDGVAYETSISFTSFSPGQVLNNINDLLGICVNIEHSWMRDLAISIQCPDGTEVVLLNQEDTGGQVFLGEPNDFDGTNPIPGVGYDYCWTPTATNGTWLEYADANLPPTLPPGDYGTFESLEGLLGCPLNGEWTIRVQDLWAIDNGFIFSWSINFAEDLFPDIEVFSPELTDFAWENNPTVFYYETDSIAASPQNAGAANYTFNVTDAFGCVYDTSINVTVLPPTHPDCYNCADNLGDQPDAVVCEGETVDIDVSSQVPLESTVVFESFPQYLIGEDNHPPSNPYEAIINVNSLFPTTLNDPQNQIVSVCFDLDTDFDGDIEVFLRAPSGEILELTTNNGGGQDNYTNTCFTPNAATAITAGTAPFTGDFQPEGDWNDLMGADVIGDWVLLMADEFGNNQFGTFNDWSITFNTTNEIDYTWTNANTLSCNDCPTPTASPTTTTTYTVTAEDNYGCVFDEQITIGVVNNQLAPDVSCEVTSDTEIVFSWPAVSGIMDYEINVISNGVASGFQGPYSDLTYVASNLNPNTEVTLEVRVYTGNAPLNCTVEIGSATCTNDNCFLDIAQVSAITDVSCFGLSDGAITVAAADGNEPYIFSIDNSGSTQGSGSFTGITAGDHFIAVQDADMCTDTLFFTINQPEEIVLTGAIDQEISCFEGTNGILSASATGGDGNYTIAWGVSPLVTGPVLTDVSAGTYEIGVLDGQGCSGLTSITIEDPVELTLSLDSQNASCNDQNNGSIEAIVAGGTGDYTFTWDPALPNQGTQTGLQAGQYCVTVSDENGCSTDACVDLSAPDALEITAIDITPVDCAGNNTGTASVTVEGGDGNYSYLWNDDLAQIDATAVFLIAGSYTVQITDGGGCQIDAEVMVPEPELLEISFEVSDVLCRAGSDGFATAIPEGGTGPYTYLWETDGTEATEEGFEVGVYTVIVTDDNGCTAEADVQIDEPAEAVSVVVEQTKIGCYGQSDNEATVSAMGGTGTNYTYEWSDTQTTAVAVGLDTLLYSVIARDENGCEAEIQIELVDLPEIDFIINTIRPSCFGYPDGTMGANLVEGGSGTGYTYQWSNNQFTPVINDLLGGQVYSVTVTDSEGCQTARERELPQPPEITFEFDIQDVLCNGDETGEATVVNIQGENDVYTFQWDANSGGSITETASDLSIGTYSVIVTDDEDCFSEAQVSITQPTAIAIEFETVDNICHGDEEGAVSAMVSGGIADYTYDWDIGSDQSKLNDLPAGTYELSITDGNGCVEVAQAVVEQPDRLALGIDTEDVTCYGDRDGTIFLDVQGGTPPYAYSLDNETYNGASTIVGLVAGEYNVFIRDANDCRIFDETSIVEPEEFMVRVQEERVNVTLGDSIQLFAGSENGEGQVFYEWTAPYDGTLSCTDCRAPWVNSQNTITYELYGVDSRGCEDTDFITVVVNKNRVVEVATGFTPNGDNTNDLLMVHGRKDTKILLFEIYDRWGELVYQNGNFTVNDPSVGWDGTFRGEMMQGGVYIWYIEAEYIDGAQEVFKGQTTLIR